MLNYICSIGAGTVGAIIGGLIALIGITSVTIKYMVTRKKK